MKVNPRWYLGLYALLIVAALPLAFRLIPPNRWYGFRIPGRLIDPERWYAINAVGGAYFAISMAICLVVNMLLLWQAPKELLRYIHWINASLIFLSFWLVTLQLLDLLN
ncbi:MAG: SdpI family protein [Candidatus Lambdaproteobacteria bacterium]|nr:SdpI family protein [Candidatus Lambdaproteobacteria bacterium]